MLFLDASFGRPMLELDQIELDESGSGYALRMVRRNGLTFNDLVRAFASPGHKSVPHNAGGKVAFAFGATPARVFAALPQLYRERGKTLARFKDHAFTRSYHIRQTRPQVCGQCISQLGRALCAWDISLFTACPRHKCYLVDKCPACDRPVSWRRPDIGRCWCKSNFASWDLREAEPLHIELSALIETHLSVQAGRARGMLTLDCLLRLVRALGISETSDGADLVPGALTRLLSTEHAIGVVTRALGRCSVLQSHSLKMDFTGCPTWMLRSVFEGASATDYALMRQALDKAARLELACSELRVQQHQLSIEGLDHDN